MESDYFGSRSGVAAHDFTMSKFLLQAARLTLQYTLLVMMERPAILRALLPLPHFGVSVSFSVYFKLENTRDPVKPCEFL